MWTGETVFSEGDLCNVPEYLESLRHIEDAFVDIYARRSHVANMIKRLNCELELLDRLCSSDDLSVGTFEYDYILGQSL